MKQSARNETPLIAKIAAVLLASTTLLVSSAVGYAKPFVWARSGDALTLDPHAVNEGTTHAFNHQIYEPLIIRDRTGKLEAALAKTWTQSVDPLAWTFELRSGVTFHDGQAMTAADVIFSLKRALSPASDLRSRLQSIKSFKALAPDKIEIRTHVRDPLLPIRLTDIFIMSKSWSEKHDVAVPRNFLTHPSTYTAAHANGTGPYRLISRKPGVETLLARNDRYWGWKGIDLTTRIDEIMYRPIPDDKARIDALLTGNADFVQDVPLTELDVLRQAPKISLKSGPENRVIFLGLSVKPTYAGNPNPLANSRLRDAIAIAIDRQAVQRKIMLGQSIPTAVLAPPGINGFPFELDQIPPRNLAQARDLLKTAGIAKGTELTLDCPSHRYVNDVAICKAIAGQLADIGLKVTPVIRAKGPHFKIVRSGQSQFYLLGWGVPTFDSAYIFTNLLHSRGQKLGTWNGTGFSDPAIDTRISQLSQLTDSSERSRSMTALWLSLRESRIYVPIHVQTLIYAMRAGVTIDVDISNTPKLKHAIIEAATPDAKSQ